MSDLSAISLVLNAPSGMIELQDPGSGYSLASDTFSTKATTHRKQEIQSEWMDGTFYGRSAKENVIETISVWVSGSSQYEFTRRMDALVEGFEQLQYSMAKTVGDAYTLWTCFVADHTIETNQSFINATTGLLKLQVPRLPNVVLSQVAGP